MEGLVRVCFAFSGELGSLEAERLARGPRVAGMLRLKS